MKYSIILLAILFSNTCQTQNWQTDPSIISQPLVIEDDDWKFEGSENIILVPENRNVDDSRMIGLHFFRFPAREKSDLPPVVFLGAGPGEPYSVEVFYDGKRAEAWRYELDFVNQKRDVILINQRGNPRAPGLQISEFRYRWFNGGSLDKPFDIGEMEQNRKEAYAKACIAYKNKGVDLRGYDIVHFVDDIETIRRYFAYEQLAFVGNSFASQWALAYIQRYPENVDRALFSGVEPLDNNYDDPKGIWDVYLKIDKYARANAELAKKLPEIGVTEAFKTVIRRLEQKPVEVALKDEDGEERTIVVGADDLMYNLMYPNSTSYVSEIESWPKYISEMYNGDFRILAGASLGRIYSSSALMINPLVNNSLGITKERESVLNDRASRKWLGNINRHYTTTRDICPAPKVADDFRIHKSHDIPIIIIHGDLDLSTPFENASFLMKSLENGHLIKVEGGFHNAKRALIFADRPLMNDVYQFMNIDFEEVSFQEFRKSLPSQYKMPEFNFWPVDGKALYDME